VPELGLLLLPDRPVPELARLASLAEELAYDVLWVADEKFYRDPWVVLAAAAGATSRIRLGPGVTEPYARHPALIASAMASLEELCPGRSVVGLGAGGPGFPPMGVERRRPAAAMADAVAILRGLLAGRRVDHEGAVLSFRGGSLSFRPRYEPPVYVAARGRRMLAAAAVCGDGVIMAPFASREAVTRAGAVVRSAARAAGRPAPHLVARVDVCVAQDPDAARRAVRRFVALPLWVSYPDWGYAEGLGVRLPDGLRDLMARRDYRDLEAAGELLPGEMLEHFAIAGAEAEVERRVTELLPLVDQLLVHPVPAPGDSRERLMERVAALWRRLVDHRREQEGTR
jgi:5,10-methylenetetrahydromethanopterin reductase